MVLPDGKALLSGLRFSSLWDMKTGKQLGPRIDHGTSIATISPDGKLIAATDDDGNVRLYDVATGMPRPGVYPHQGKVYDLGFSRDGKLLATGCGRRSEEKKDQKVEKRGADDQSEGFVHLYDVSDGTASRAPRWGHGMRSVVTCVKICPHGKVVTGGGFELRSWTVAGGTFLDTRFSPESTSQIAFDPKDTTEYIACNPSGGLQILRRDEEIRLSGERLSPQGRVAGAGFRDNGQVFTANTDGVVCLWNRPLHGSSSHTAGQEFKPPQAEAILSVAFHPDGQGFALGAKTGIVFYYEHPKAEPKQFVCAPPAGRARPVIDLRFSTDGTRIMAHDEDLSTFVFDTKGESRNPLPVPGRLIGVAADGRTAVFQIGKDDPQQKGTHELRSGTGVIQARKVEYQIAEVGSNSLPVAPKMVVPGGVGEFRDGGDGQQLRVSRVAFNPDRSVVALLDWAGVVHLFRTATGEEMCAPIRHGTEAEGNPIWAVVFCPAGDTLLTRSPKARGMWDARTGTPIDMLTNRVGIQVTRFSPRGKLVMGGTNFNMAQVWDTTGREVVPTPLVHGAQVWAVAATPDETRIITASFDRTARIWDRATGRSISPPIRHRQGVSDVTFSPDGRYALTGSWDGTARLWKVADPLPDQPDRIRAWIQTLTGLNLNGDLMTADDWAKSKAELNRLGGPPPGTVP
jgi:WD40 repeat protein